MEQRLAALPLCFVLACEGDASSPEAATDESSTSGGTGQPAEGDESSSAVTSGGSSTSAEPPGTSGQGTSTGTEPIGSSSGDADPPPDFATPHFPLQLGLQWTYRLTRTDGSIGADCINDGREHVQTVTDETGGVFTKTEAPYCYSASLQFRIEDPFVDVNNGAWYHQLLLPPVQGETWAAGGASGASYIWDEHHATYTVEAGVFEDCWRRKQQGYDVWELYCRDVGMVESYYDAWGSNGRSELVAFDMD